MVFFQDVLQAHTLEKVEKITGTEMLQGEIEPEGEALVSPKGKVLRPSGIIMVYSPTLFITVSISIWAPDP